MQSGRYTSQPKRTSQPERNGINKILAVTETPLNETLLPDDLKTKVMEYHQFIKAAKQYSHNAFITYQLDAQEIHLPTKQEILKEKNENRSKKDVSQDSLGIVCPVCLDPHTLVNMKVFSSCGHATCSDCCSRLQRGIRFIDWTGAIVVCSGARCPTCEMISVQFTNFYVDPVPMTVDSTQVIDSSPPEVNDQESSEKRKIPSSSPSPTSKKRKTQ